MFAVDLDGIFTQEKGSKWGFSNANGERKANFRGDFPAKFPICGEFLQRMV
jgi:hypothetical protein